jgi:hypothetical protein
MIVFSLLVFGYLEFKLEKENVFYVELIFWFFIIVLFFILIYVYKFGKYFEYDSDGEALCFRNSGTFISESFNYREKRAEFPKKKLKKYEVKNYLIVKKLYVYVKSSYAGEKRVKKLIFDITFVKQKRINMMRASLSKAISQNRKKAHGSRTEQ